MSLKPDVFMNIKQEASNKPLFTLNNNNNNNNKDSPFDEDFDEEFFNLRKRDPTPPKQKSRSRDSPFDEDMDCYDDDDVDDDDNTNNATTDDDPDYKDDKSNSSNKNDELPPYGSTQDEHAVHAVLQVKWMRPKAKMHYSKTGVNFWSLWVEGCKP